MSNGILIHFEDLAVTRDDGREGRNVEAGKSISACAATEKLGASRWWGYPDMPADWDGDAAEAPLTLICQINLADLPDDSAPEFPHEGLLLFFANIDYYLGRSMDPAISMHVSDAESVRVIYVPKEDMPRLERRYEASADIALKQIEDMGYADKFKEDSREVIRIGVNYSSNERNINHWLIG